MKERNATIEEILREKHPYGHKDFISMALEEVALHSIKNHDYADGGKATGNFDRVAKILSLYPGLHVAQPSVVAVLYLMKQLDAALWIESNGHVTMDQSKAERWRDVAVYAKLISILDQEEK